MRSWANVLEKQIADLENENIRLTILCKTAAEEIREMDDVISKLVEAFDGAKDYLPYYDDDPLACPGMSSINLLNALDGTTSTTYLNAYDNELQRMKVKEILYRGIISRINDLDKDTNGYKEKCPISKVDSFLDDVRALKKKIEEHDE